MFQSISDQNNSKIYWIASYPRSGNTFVRILLSNYIISKDKSIQINEIYNFIPADTKSKLWDRVTPDLWKKAAQEQKWLWRASLIEEYRKQGLTRPFPGMKTHTINLPVFNQPAFSFSPADRIVYIVRHPLDVLMSYADYNGRDLDKAISIMSASGTCIDSDTPGGFEPRGSWREHVASWLNCTDCPVLLVRYEDLCDRTETTLRDVLTFLDIPIDEERLRRAISFSAFSSLQQQEAEDGFRERPDVTLSGKFFREGRSRQWLKALSPERAYRLADHCGDVMTKLGYTHPRDVYFDGRNAYGPVKF